MKQSHHAIKRACLRSIKTIHIEYTLSWGTIIRQKRGRLAYHMGKKDWSLARKAGFLIPESVIGVIVIVAKDDVIVTVARSTSRIRLKRKSK